MASSEEIELKGRELTITHRLGRWIRGRRHQLGAETRAELAQSPGKWQTNQNSGESQPRIVLTDSEGREVSLGAHATPGRKEQLAERINRYLQVHGGD